MTFAGRLIYSSMEIFKNLIKLFLRFPCLIVSTSHLTLILVNIKKKKKKKMMMKNKFFLKGERNDW